MKLLIALIFTSVFGCGPSVAPGYESVTPFENPAGKYAGTWTRTEYRAEVTIESWGDRCGPEPKSFQLGKPISVEVTVEGEHLVFSKGGLRTDRCWSPNKRLQLGDTVVDSGAWKWSCATRHDDPKFESVESQLTAVEDDWFEAVNTSHFDWKTDDGPCTAVVRYTHVYQRNAPWIDGGPEQ
jgi:hypothetical protein